MFFEIWQSVRPVLGAIRSTIHWVRQGYASPYPHYMKQATILRHAIPGSLFIETGTYKGATSRYFRNRGFSVATVEVSQSLYETYSPYLRKLGIDTRLGDSADVVPQLLHEHVGSPSLTFFLDGHYSSGITSKGDQPVPIVREFQAISTFAKMNPEKTLSVIVDDVRLFMPGGDPAYPARSTLMAFADSIDAHWSIENDLFVCKRFAPAKFNAHGFDKSS